MLEIGPNSRTDWSIGRFV